MRGLRKPWPPRNVSKDGATPRSFREAEQEFLAALPSSEDKKAFADTEYNRLEKPKLRAVLLREQGHLCIFCEQRVENSDSARIDHWRPRNACPDLAVHWKNLHLSCDAPETCDIRKGGRQLRWRDDDPDLPWPVDCQYENLIGYTSAGEMYVRADVLLDDATRMALENALDDLQDGNVRRPSTLNLNHPTLVAARAAVLDSERSRLQREFAGRHAERADREQRAAARLEADPLPIFVSIRVAWLRRELGKGQEARP